MTEVLVAPFSLRQLYQGGRLSQYLLLLACAAAVVGLFASRALVALSPIVGLVAACTQPNLRASLKQWFHLRTVVCIALLYVFLVISGTYTTQYAVWQHEIYRKLPLLIVPLAFAVAVPLTERQKYGIGLLYVVLATSLAISTLGRYLLDPEEANRLISIGQNVPAITGIFHIHFSIMLALAFFFALLLRRNPLATPSVRWVLLGCATLMFIIMHVLAYRTGLMVLYAMLLFDAVILIMLQRRFVLGVLVLVAMVGLPLGAYLTLEPIQGRVAVTLEDIDQYQSGRNINDYSLAKRFAAWETATIIAREHPWLGVGMADVDAAMLGQYSYHNFGLKPKNWVMTHNQYLEYLVGGGAVGLLLWLLVLFGPFLQPALRQNPYVIHFLLMMSVANLVDSLLQMQIGFNLFVFLYGFIVVSAERAARSPANVAT
ncbi:O-antigen ligase family protein [Hymenobacter sp. BT186]|uniref:O-antigen ligase family protein n=1 Tax=Hymenobacter telluris TaxID=2816474 RepID=A0A939EV91_9BACT|nr:O-antigen ligase family protein [Hymenobacter telluris]MBO0357127.1 O-antigen ligase family protein [Hymenobacter telluris]MBW3373154.1 O-antigen ligase family protein [Hymenobacter norwichensis]